MSVESELVVKNVMVESSSIWQTKCNLVKWVAGKKKSETIGHIAGIYAINLCGAFTALASYEKRTSPLSVLLCCGYLLGGRTQLSLVTLLCHPECRLELQSRPFALRVNLALRWSCALKQSPQTKPFL